MAPLEGAEGNAPKAMYVCNCNGIRERDVRAAIENGAQRPADVFRANKCQPQCAKCVCDVKAMIDVQARVMKMAAE